MRVVDYFRAARLFYRLAFRIFGTGKFRLFPYRYEELLIWGTLHDEYDGDLMPEDFIWISPKTAWEVARDIWR